MKKFFCYVVLILFIFIPSCSSDDEPEAPNDSVAVNVGLGKGVVSGVYLDSLGNFFWNSSINFGVLENNAGLDANLEMFHTATHAAAEPGNYYQVIVEDECSYFKDITAFPLNKYYYNLYVDSWIYDSQNNLKGAKIIYSYRKPTSKVLPEWNSVIKMNLEPISGQDVEAASYSFDEGCVIEEVYDAIFNKAKLEIKADGNKITCTNTNTAAASNILAVLTLFVRHGCLFSQVKVRVYSSY